MPPRIPTTISQSPLGTYNPKASNGLNTGLGPGAQIRKGPVLSREHFTDRQQNRIQAAANQAMQQATAAHDAGEVVLAAVTFAANTPLTLAHGLGQTWTGYRIENMLGSFASFVALPQGGNNTKGAADAQTIVVEANANCTADVIVW